LLIDGDQVALCAWISGTDRGGFMGMEPTGRAVKMSIAFLYQLRDGQIASEYRIYDFTGLLVQVGMLKAKPA
jgi:predicted ester cyclase